MEALSTIKEHDMLFNPLVGHVPEEDDGHGTLASIRSGEIKAYLKPGLDGIRYGVLKQANDKVYVMLVWLQDTILSCGKRLNVS